MLRHIKCVYIDVQVKPLTWNCTTRNIKSRNDCTKQNIAKKNNNKTFGTRHDSWPQKKKNLHKWHASDWNKSVIKMDKNTEKAGTTIQRSHHIKCTAHRKQTQTLVCMCSFFVRADREKNWYSTSISLYFSRNRYTSSLYKFITISTANNRRIAQPHSHFSFVCQLFFFILCALSFRPARKHQ